VQLVSTELEAGEFELSGHPVHTVAPATIVVYLPAAHVIHASAALAPVVDKDLPGIHVMHVLDVFAPTTAEYVPAPQLVHSAAPPVEYVPDTQFVQTVDCHCEFVDVPAGQDVHVVDLYVCVYFPGSHM
jgi:hypothetical protein